MTSSSPHDPPRGAGRRAESRPPRHRVVGTFFSVLLGEERDPPAIGRKEGGLTAFGPGDRLRVEAIEVAKIDRRAQRLVDGRRQTPGPCRPATVPAPSRGQHDRGGRSELDAHADRRRQARARGADQSIHEGTASATAIPVTAATRHDRSCDGGRGADRLVRWFAELEARDADVRQALARILLQAAPQERSYMRRCVRGSADHCGSSRMIATNTSLTSDPANARLPVSISNSTQPKAQMSARRSTTRPLACSGLM